MPLVRIVIIILPTALSSGGVLLSSTMADHNRDRMKDVSHTPPNGESVTNVWDRGTKRADADDAPADD